MLSSSFELLLRRERFGGRNRERSRGRRELEEKEKKQKREWDEEIRCLVL